MKRIQLLILLFSMPAHAEGIDGVAACASVDELDEYVVSCGSNEKVTGKARECTDKLLASWKKAAEELQENLTAHGENQKLSELETKNDLTNALKTLDAQILYMQDGANLVASYPDIMVDIPDSEDDEGSLDCFNENFHAVEGMVHELDDEVIRAKDLYEKIIDMRSTADSRHRKLDKSAVTNEIARGLKGVGSGKSLNSKSTITGIKEKASLADSGKTTKVQRPKVKRDPSSLVTGDAFGPRLKAAPAEKAAGSVPASAGEALWNEADPSTKKLELDPDLSR